MSSRNRDVQQKPRRSAGADTAHERGPAEAGPVRHILATDRRGNIELAGLEGRKGGKGRRVDIICGVTRGCRLVEDGLVSRHTLRNDFSGVRVGSVAFQEDEGWLKAFLDLHVSSQRNGQMRLESIPLTAMSKRPKGAVELFRTHEVAESTTFFNRGKPSPPLFSTRVVPFWAISNQNFGASFAPSRTPPLGRMYHGALWLPGFEIPTSVVLLWLRSAEHPLHCLPSAPAQTMLTLGSLLSSKFQNCGVVSRRKGGKLSDGRTRTLPERRNVPFLARTTLTSGFTGRGSIISVSCTSRGTVLIIFSIITEQVDVKFAFDSANLRKEGLGRGMTSEDKVTYAFRVTL
jgi:hypothetical protein